MIFLIFFIYKFYKKISVATWFYPEDRRNFFENYAKSKGFDPLVPDNWYNVTREQVMSFKVSQSLFFMFIFTNKKNLKIIFCRGRRRC
jgi:hypothetical protein